VLSIGVNTAFGIGQQFVATSIWLFPKLHQLNQIKNVRFLTECDTIAALLQTDTH
jgi:hypothetical protein